MVNAQKLIRPAFLEKGDGIAVISPSYRMEPSSLEAAMDTVRDWGYEPVAAPCLNVGKGQYAGDADTRASDLIWALKERKSKAILCSRGGYGALHLLGRVPLELFRAKPKWLVGYSDITTLHAMSVASGVESVHGMMLSSVEKDAGKVSADALISLLSGLMPSYSLPADKYNVHGSAGGRMVGGNFITMNALLGTDYDFLGGGQDVILFVEEVEESMHAIDRLFNVLMLRKSFNRVKGIVFGQFTDCPSDLPYDSVEQMLSEYLPAYGIPVAFGFPAGHGHPNLPFIEGAAVELTVDASGSRIVFL